MASGEITASSSTASSESYAPARPGATCPERYGPWQICYDRLGYGITDGFAVWLTAALLFIVLFYVYPLKFLFTMLVDQLLGFGTEVRTSSGAVVEAIRAEQWPLLMVIYGAGFVAVQLVFVAFYLRAYTMRGELGLNAHERSMTREELQGFLINTGVGAASISIAFLGGAGPVAWAGWVYLLIIPLQIANGRLMRSRRERIEESPGGGP